MNHKQGGRNSIAGALCSTPFGINE